MSMDPGLKTNDHIRADNAAFIAAYHRARETLAKLDGVVGVGFGRKEKGGRFTSAMAIEVFVREKKDAGAVPPEQRIPATFEGYRTDVRVVPSITRYACDDQTKYGTVQGGIQIQARKKDSNLFGDNGKGTLGCIVRKRHKGDGDDNVYLLTCRHVLFANGDESSTLYVYQPSAPASGDTTGNQLLGAVEGAGVAEEVRHEVADGRLFFCYVDAALARIDLGSTCFGKSCKPDRIQFDTTILQLNGLDPNQNRIADVRDVIVDLALALPPGDDFPDPPIGDPGTPPNLSAATDDNRVYKVGRTTSKTTGIVICVNASAQDNNNFLHSVIEIAFDPASTTLGVNCKGNEIFGEAGDSGSLIVDKDNKAIGLLFAGRDTTGETHSKHMTYACHIAPVLDALNVCIPSAGTSHGTIGATDGSGLATAATSEQLLAPTTGGGAVFVSHVRSGTPRVESQEPAVFSSDQRDRVAALADMLGETPRGRALYDALSDSHREISYLVRTCRPVQIVWHRNRGPAFLACALACWRGDAATLPREIGGISRATFLERMRDVLVAHGSSPLRYAIERHGADVMVLSDAETIQDCLVALRRADPVGAPP